MAHNRKRVRLRGHKTFVIVNEIIPRTSGSKTCIFAGIPQVLDSYAKEYNSPCRIWLGTDLVVIISDAENAEIILKSKDCLNKPMLFYKSVKDALKADGLITIDGLLSDIRCEKCENNELFWSQRKDGACIDELSALSSARAFFGPT